MLTSYLQKVHVYYKSPESQTPTSLEKKKKDKAKGRESTKVGDTVIVFNNQLSPE